MLLQVHTDPMRLVQVDDPRGEGTAHRTQAKLTSPHHEGALASRGERRCRF